ncbi:hypothetical protein M405DRAFT_885060, partial [Rhizopogon salebrosus TDB-379]
MMSRKNQKSKKNNLPRREHLEFLEQQPNSSVTFSSVLSSSAPNPPTFPIANASGPGQNLQHTLGLSTVLWKFCPGPDALAIGKVGGFGADEDRTLENSHRPNKIEMENNILDRPSAMEVYVA